MKRTILYLVACMLLITSCQEDGEELFRLPLDQLEGEWVYDAPQEGVWEVQKFMPSGVFYYSNKSIGSWKFQNSMNDGRYWIEEGNRVTCQYFLNEVPTQIKFTVLDIS